MYPCSEETLRALQASHAFRWCPGMDIDILFRDHPCAPVSHSDRMRVAARTHKGKLDLSEYKWMNCTHDPLLCLTPATLGWLVAFAQEQDPCACVIYRDDPETELPWCAQGGGQVEQAATYADAVVQLFFLVCPR